MVLSAITLCSGPFLWAAPASSRKYTQVHSSGAPANTLIYNANYGKLPLAFEPNRGQVDMKALFIGRGNGYSLTLTSEGLFLALRKQHPKGSVISSRSKTRQAPTPDPVAPPDVIGLKWDGARRNLTYEGERKLPGFSNYIPSNDRSQWHTLISQYAQVRAREIYPYTDVTYYGNQGQVEYDLTVKPGGNPKAIRLKVEGAIKTTVTDQGDLELETRSGKKVTLRAPILYQEMDGQRQTVAGGWRMDADGGIGFAVQNYDKTRPLVIDPVLDYSSYLGGTTLDIIDVVAVDAAGNAYVAGTAPGNYPTTAGAYQTSFSATTNSVVSKIDPTGATLLYSTYLGPGNTEISGIAVNSSGNAFVMTTNAPTGFPTTAGSFEPASASGGPALAELNTTGSALVYSTYLGGGGSAGGEIGLNSSGDVYVTGTTDGDLAATAGAYQTTVQGRASVFLAEIDPVGGGASDLLFCTYLGCSGGVVTYNGNPSKASLYELALGPGGTVYVAGSANAGMPTTPGCYQSGPVSMGNPSPYLAVFNSTGSALLYCTYVGYLFCESVAVDPSGAAYLTGYTWGNFPTTAGAFQPTGNLDVDTFVSKVNPGGNGSADLVYSTYVGGNGMTDTGEGIVVDAWGRAYVVGYADDTTYPTTAGAYQTAYNGTANNAILSELNPAGTGLVYSTYFDGTAWDSVGEGIALGSDNGVYIVGYGGSGFPTTSGVFQSTYGGALEGGFVTKFDSSSFGVPTITPTPTNTTTPTNTSTPTSTATETRTATPTSTNSPTVVITSTCTSTFTATKTATATSTATLSSTATATPTVTVTSTATLSPTPTCVIHVWPDPYSPSRAVNHSLKFSCLPPGAQIGIYTLSGELAFQFQASGDPAQWNGRNKNGLPVASGIYFYTIEQGQKVLRTDKFLLVP